MVAKSYQGLEELTRPYEIDGRSYIKVRTKRGDAKQVRWYSDREYLSMYGPSTSSKYYKTQKIVLGFKEGYITLLYNPSHIEDFYFKSIGASKTKFWDWYIKSDKPMPELPPEVIPIKLYWADVGNENETLKPDNEVYAATRRALKGVASANEEQVLDVGDAITVSVSVVKVIDGENSFGSSYFHVMKDEGGNTYTWRTNARRLIEGHNYRLSGKIKGFENYEGEIQTQIYYCKATEI